MGVEAHFEIMAVSVYHASYEVKQAKDFDDKNFDDY
jgi:hypothetical protein